MKREYEEKIFDFYTQKENFETMVQVANAFPLIANKLLQSFWVDLSEALKKMFSPDEWIVGFSDSNFDVKHNKLWVYRKDWKLECQYPKIAVGFECLQLNKNCFVGVFINEHQKKHNNDAVRFELRNLNELVDFNQDGNKFWVKWEEINPLITKQNQIDKINCGEREAIIDGLVSQVAKFVNAIDNKILPILIKHKV